MLSEDPTRGAAAPQHRRGLEENDEAEFQRFGPAAAVDTQTATDSQWLRETLDRESGNFLEFVRAEIAARAGGDGDGDHEAEMGEAASGGGGGGGVAFESILAPAKHSKTVAAQGFYHVLALATKGALDVEQDVAFGPIRLEIVG